MIIRNKKVDESVEFVERVMSEMTVAECIFTAALVSHQASLAACKYNVGLKRVDSVHGIISRLTTRGSLIFGLLLSWIFDEADPSSASRARVKILFGLSQEMFSHNLASLNKNSTEYDVNYYGYDPKAETPEKVGKL